MFIKKDYFQLSNILGDDDDEDDVDDEEASSGDEDDEVVEGEEGVEGEGEGNLCSFNC